ncbi:aromatic acid exporter family protein [Bacillus timonensis]|nr:aromatic acid exporter family protein [Bacillus timonensis]
MKLGARILKTGIAITLALFIAHALELPSPVFAGIAAIFAIQPSIYRSYLSVVEQLQANIIGAFFAICFALLFGNDPFIIGLTAVIVISINLKLKIENTIPVALVTVIAIMQGPEEQFLQFALIRFSTILLGVLSALVVNLAFLPPKHENKLYQKILDQTEEIFKWIRLNIRHASDHQALKADIEKSKETLLKIEQLYLLYKEERNYFKKQTLEKSRKLVIYRQMIATSTRALETLKLLHRLENELHHMPISFQQLIIVELDDLIHLHEQLMLKFIGKSKGQPPEELQSHLGYDRKQVIESFLQNQDKLESKDDRDWYQLFPLVSAITDYSFQLEHLETLVDSFQNYHQDEHEPLFD